MTLAHLVLLLVGSLLTIIIQPSSLRVMSNFVVRQIGAKHSKEYRAFIVDESSGKVISPFHDIPLALANGEVNMICEIPRFTNAKLEISREEWMNPIKQDEKKGKMRFVANVHPFHGYLWNYGAIPQTWESPLVTNPETGCKGDNDPLDVIEIGQRIMHTGQVKRVKVLGVLAMLDEGETDWKIVAIDTADPLAAKLNSPADIDLHCPGLLEATRRWFRLYKRPDGKPNNEFAFQGKFLDAAYALNIIHECHGQWQDLIQGKVPAGAISIIRRINDHGHLIESQTVDPQAAPLPDLPADPLTEGFAYVQE